MRTIIGLVVGTLFGAGLAYSGMADPARVQGFLDLLGNWDPTLAFVMGGAIIPMAVAWAVQKGMHKPIAEDAFDIPGTTQLDGKLALGAVLFGMGWGIGGLCPGPGFAGLAIAPVGAATFVIALLAGMLIHKFATR